MSDNLVQFLFEGDGPVRYALGCLLLWVGSAATRLARKAVRAP